MSKVVDVTTKGDDHYGASIGWKEDIEKVEVVHDKSEGKDLVQVKVNGELIFSYDSKFQGSYMMYNNVQKPLGGKNNNYFNN